MFADIYFFGPIGRARDELEDELDDLLEGSGEVTGSGGGAAGSNFDLEFDDRELAPDKLLELLVRWVSHHRGSGGAKVMIHSTPPLVYEV